MGKLKTKAKFVRKGVHFRKVSSYVDVARVEFRRGARSGRGPFIACIKIGTGGTRFLATKPLGACASGRNPRKAIAAALRKAATSTARRSGAFARYR